MGRCVTTPAIWQTALMTENLTSDAPRTWCDQYLLRILTKRGEDSFPPRWKRSTLLNLCFLCPYLTVISLMKTRRLCGGGSSFFPTLAFDMLCQERRAPGMGSVMWEKTKRLGVYIKQPSLPPIYLKRQDDGSQLTRCPKEYYRQSGFGSTSNVNCSLETQEAS